MSKGNGVFVATETGSTVADDGEHYQFHKGKTRVREGHPLLEACPDYFKPVEDDLTFDTETATKTRGGKKDNGEVARKQAERDAEEAARLEAESEAEAAADTEGEQAPALADLSRQALNVRAVELGIEDPSKLPNKGAVVEAIEAAEAE